MSKKSKKNKKNKSEIEELSICKMPTTNGIPKCTDYNYNYEPFKEEFEIKNRIIYYMGIINQQKRIMKLNNFYQPL